MIDEGDKAVVVIQELVRVGLWQLRAWNSVQRHIVFTHGIHTVNTFPELTLTLLVAGREKVNIIKHTVVTVILDMQQT